MDPIFKALNDPARRDLLDSLRQSDGQTLGQLEEVLDMSRFGVMKHLRVLEDASLIVTRKKGRFKYHYLNAEPLQEVIDRWIDPFLTKPAARAVIDLKSQLEGTAPMLDTDTKPDFMLQTYIRCSQDALWEALLDPDKMSVYHFLSPKVVQDGERYTYEHPDGSTMMVCRTLETDPNSRIVSTFEPHWGEDAIPASKTVFLLIPEPGHMKLVIEHYDLHFPVVPGEGVADGWERWAAGLKTYLETGAASRFNEAGAV
ncbi:MAG: metalloregulator ArsR/SmtB family transcription factor [Rhodobacteraceae bacterium]|nr:metalloregulator ArsR/SmtB family transcription factor [Paracoccaceae bacterium]